MIPSPLTSCDPTVRLSTHSKMVDKWRQKYTCQFCSKVKANRHAYLIHCLSCHFYCEVCEEQFDSKKEILQHRKDVHNKVYQCEVCMDLFIAREHLTRHVIQVHLEKDETKLHHSCEVCGYSTPSVTALKEHINALHIQKRKYKCNICDFAAKTKDTLNDHMKTHDGFRHFPCEHCGQVLKSARNLRNHKCKTVLNCDHCTKTFRSIGFLEKHVKAAHSNSLFKCDICDKVFTTEFILLRHKRVVHQDESKRNCEICQKLFMNAAELFKHFREHHPNSECPAKSYIDYFPCYMCPNVLGTKPSLYFHLKCVHKTIVGGQELMKKCDEMTKTKCPQCDEIFSSFMGCTDHFIDTHGLEVPEKLMKKRGKSRYVYCRHCDFESSNILQYSQHRKNHHQ